MWRQAWLGIDKNNKLNRSTFIDIDMHVCVCGYLFIFIFMFISYTYILYEDVLAASHDRHAKSCDQST